jgi:hypothetical protein
LAENNTNQREIRVLAPTSILGGGFRKTSFERAMEWKPDLIACDAGSTDPGPNFLGSGDMQFGLPAIRRDLEIMIRAARRARIPLLIGSAETGGSDEQLAKVVQLAREIAAAHDLNFRLGVVHCEPSREYLLNKYRSGDIGALSASSPAIDETTLEHSNHIVAVGGPEVFTNALDNGADVVIAGRTTDASIFASLPVQRGMGQGASWHAAKILECSAAAVEQRLYPDPLFAWVREDHFVVEPPNPEYRCTPMSVASHNLYENGSPYELREPGGTLMSDHSVYEAISDRAVKVSGSRFEPVDQYSVKLEGTERVGYQNIIIGGVRDPLILRQFDSWLKGIVDTIRRRYIEIFGEELAARIKVSTRRYGVDGVLGDREPTPEIGHEIGLVIEITAPTQEVADTAAKTAAHISVHYPISEWTGLITGIAFPYSPHELQRGAVYRFSFNHVMKLEDPLEPFSLELISL